MKYRAAVWTSNDRQAEVRLTGPEHADLPDDKLLVEAAQFAEQTGLNPEGGKVIICDWRE